jgi:hypothetical protein
MMMTSCCHLFPAQNIKAFHLTKEPTLVISADVTLNPVADDVRICRNPLERLLPAPAVHEYMVVSTTKPGIHPDLVVKRTITASFPMDSVPAKVAVYSMGLDNPARVEIPVGDQPTQTSASSTAAAAAPATAASAAQTTTSTSSTPVQATGWAKDFVLQEALSNAVTELRAAAGFRNPDAGLHFQVVEIGGQVGGFTLNTGVFVTVKAG